VLDIADEISRVKKELGIISIIDAKKCVSGLDEIEIRGAALSLATLYNGLEKLFILMLKSLEVSIPNDNNWHANLLKLVQEHGIINGDLLSELARFLSFRHFVHHAYSFEIDPAAIYSVLEKAPAITEKTIYMIEQYITIHGKNEVV